MDMAPKILMFDIETAPNLSYVWGHWEQNVIRHEREWYLLCVGYRWLGGLGKAKCLSLPQWEEIYEKDPENDEALCRTVWELLDEADIVVGHNGDKFDIRKMNARFLRHRMPPPSPYKSLDTLKLARKYFALNSNRLSDLGEYLKVGSKAPTDGFETWAGCMRGDKKAWATMTKYCRQDVDLLVEVYDKLLPWAENHPNWNLYSTSGMIRCPRCGGEDLIKRGIRYAKSLMYQQWQCKGCQAYSRERRALPSDRPELL